MDTNSNPGYCVVSPPVLAAALHLPPGTEIVGIEWDQMYRNFRLYVKHPIFPPLIEGCPLPCSHVVITEHCDAETPDRVARTYTSEWLV